MDLITLVPPAHSHELSTAAWAHGVGRGLQERKGCTPYLCVTELNLHLFQGKLQRRRPFVGLHLHNRVGVAQLLQPLL